MRRMKDRQMDRWIELTGLLALSGCINGATAPPAGRSTNTWPVKLKMQVCAVVITDQLCPT